MEYILSHPENYSIYYATIHILKSVCLMKELECKAMLHIKLPISKPLTFRFDPGGIDVF